MSTGHDTKPGHPNGSTGRDANAHTPQQPIPLGAAAVYVLPRQEQTTPPAANAPLPFFRVFNFKEHIELACIQAADETTAISRVAMVAHLLPRHIRHAAYNAAQLEARPRKPGKMVHSAQFTNSFFACHNEAMSLRNGPRNKGDNAED
jgi:hypothetical protein